MLGFPARRVDLFMLWHFFILSNISSGHTWSFSLITFLSGNWNHQTEKLENVTEFLDSAFRTCLWAKVGNFQELRNFCFFLTLPSYLLLLHSADMYSDTILVFLCVIHYLDVFNHDSTLWLESNPQMAYIILRTFFCPALHLCSSESRDWDSNNSKHSPLRLITSDINKINGTTML